MPPRRRSGAPCAHFRSGLPRVNEAACNACDKCAERCPTKAIEVQEFGDTVSVDVEYDKCIGCGVCITACNKDCMWLERRPAAA